MGVAKRKVKKVQRRAQSELSWDAFLARYTSILFEARDWVIMVSRVAQKSGEQSWVTVPQIARHLATNRPAAYIKTFGEDDPLELKEWRILSILRNAGYLGAWQALGLCSSRGKGVWAKARKGSLRVVK